MADNDRFVIVLVVKPKECNDCESVFETCEITCPHNWGKGKTRAEYEDVILQTINEELDKVTKDAIADLDAMFEQ